MKKFNHLQYHRSNSFFIDNALSMSALIDNNSFDELCLKYKDKFGYSQIKTFAMSKEGFLGLFLELDGVIAVSIGECEAVVQGAKLYEKLGFSIIWLPLKEDGTINTTLITQDIDFCFISSYIMDTFVKTDIEEIKKTTNAKIISNGSAHISLNSDALYFDNYKLNGFNTSAVLLYDNNLFELLSVGLIDTIACKIAWDAINNQYFNLTIKQLFIQKLQKKFLEDIYFFVEPQITLEYSLHFGLKNIKARELIRTLALNKIFITNGEGCSLGQSKPSRIIQSMGYDETTSRNSIQLTFVDDMNEQEMDDFIKLFYLKYKQIQIIQN